MFEPTAYEQYMLELTNRARQNPLAEAARYNFDLNEGLQPGTISAEVKQPLAFNFDLIEAARDHSQWMLDNDTFDHGGENGSRAGDRIVAAGYELTGNWTWGENLALQLYSTNTPDLTAFIELQHQSLLESAGHRENIMNGNFHEIGIGTLTGEYEAFNALMSTQNFAASGSLVFLTGVAFDDSVIDDDFYSVGEGLGDIKVEAVRQSDNQAFATTTMDAGGYQLALEAGTYEVTFAADGVTYQSETVTIGTENIKVDLDLNNVPIPNSEPPTASKPDLVGSKFVIQTQELLNAGESFDVSFAIENGSAARANAFEVKFYLSPNSTISVNDTYLGAYTFNTLAGNSTTATVNTTLTLPGAGDSFWNGDNNYYVGMVINPDKTFSETDFNNNANTQELADYDSVQINPNVLSVFTGTPGDNASLQGSDGVDTIIGLTGSDIINGAEGADTLIGVDSNSPNPGQGEVDTLIGGSGRDLFVLGDKNEAYYNDGKNKGFGRKDYALIEDFNANEDVIQLHGNTEDYRLHELKSGLGTVILWETSHQFEGIALLEGVSNLDLGETYFDFVI